jgi:hypothetical protein
MRDDLELFFRNAPSYAAVIETHVDSIWSGVAFPEDTISANNGSDSASRNAQPVRYRGARPQTNFLFFAHDHAEQLLSRLNQGGFPQTE